MPHRRRSVCVPLLAALLACGAPVRADPPASPSPSAAPGKLDDVRARLRSLRASPPPVPAVRGPGGSVSLRKPVEMGYRGFGAKRFEGLGMCEVLTRLENASTVHVRVAFQARLPPGPVHLFSDGGPDDAPLGQADFRIERDYRIAGPRLDSTTRVDFRSAAATRFATRFVDLVALSHVLQDATDAEPVPRDYSVDGETYRVTPKWYPRPPRLWFDVKRGNTGVGRIYFDATPGAGATLHALRIFGSGWNLSVGR